MRKLLLLLPGAFTGYGGIEMYNRHLVKAFHELSGEMGLELRTLILNDRSADVDPRYLVPSAIAPRGFGRRKALFVLDAVRQVLSFGPDVILYGHIHFAPLGRLLRRVSRHAQHWYVAYGIEAWGPLRRPLREEIERANRVLAISEHTRQALATHSGRSVDRIQLHPCALDPVWQQQWSRDAGENEDRRADEAVLLTVARLDASERYKGVDAVIRVLPEITRRRPRVRYEVVGDGDDRSRLEALAGEVGVTDHIRFRGRLDPEKLAKAYGECTLYVMPSSREGFGIVFLEAAMFGKPSIGGRHGGTPEVIEDGVTGVLVDQSDGRGLAAAIEGLLDDACRRRTMGRAARERLRSEFEFPRFAARTRRLLSDEAETEAVTAEGDMSRGSRTEPLEGTRRADAR